MTAKVPEKWFRVDGSVVSCTESVKVLNENWHEARDMLQEMFEDAVLLGCGKEAFKEEFRRLINDLDCDYKELLQPVEAKGALTGKK